MVVTTARSRQVSTEAVFDRAADQALAEAYRVLAPERRAYRGVQKESDDDNERKTTTTSSARSEAQLVACAGAGGDTPAPGGPSPCVTVP